MGYPRVSGTSVIVPQKVQKLILLSYFACYLTFKGGTIVNGDTRKASLAQCRQMKVLRVIWGGGVYRT